ncbi:hypothetical protein SAMN05444920_13373 [Nonomuraea solani]|uniref:Uncharacterized protein n=1 Tax=Nonomuraea solani TaxID=1144553 RepID=A0A1H6F1U0_9ACTN|nr:hypothetical protein SAMN05444920_13373 [Nonomuraea solani]
MARYRPGPTPRAAVLPLGPAALADHGGMPHVTDLYDLLASFGFDSEEYGGFHLVWAEGMGASM